MTEIFSPKEIFFSNRKKLFQQNPIQKDALKFSLEYSLLVEDFVRSLLVGRKYDFAIASCGSFGRRELSPYSDIDIMFIAESIDKNKADISGLITKFWDNGIEVSHTLREFSDIKKYLYEDLHTFTQFFETRFIYGSDKIYNKWNEEIFAYIDEKATSKLLEEFLADTEDRYTKYGESPKTLEPNVKLSAGGLRDFQVIEWMYILKYKTLLNKQIEASQTEIFIDILRKKGYTTHNECNRLLQSYKLVIAVRNLLHLFQNQKNDRFEFNAQIKISEMLYSQSDALELFMKEYFKAANIVNRFSKSMFIRFQDEISNPLPDSLAIYLDDDYVLKGKTISLSNPKVKLSLSDILRAFYYHGLHTAHFDENLRSVIIEEMENFSDSDLIASESSVFFREILKLPKNVGQTLTVMNELGVLSVFLPEFKDLVGFMQHGVYHCYTADEHTLITIQNVEKLEKDTSTLGKLFNTLKEREMLYLGLLLHDIAKPIDIAGHEIIGTEMASSIMHRLGYSEEEIDMVTFLVHNHLVMEQVAFRRNLNDPETLNNFTSRFPSTKYLDLLYLVTYADLSAVNPAVWTSWKSELLSELHRKTKSMLEDQITGEELLVSSTYVIPQEISKYSPNISDDHVQEHIDLINDIAYAHQFSDKEIAQHVEEILKGTKLSTLYKELNDFTNITVITTDFPALLSKICGILSINDANIHDAKIFTRKDDIVIDTFNVTDFRTGRKIEPARYDKITRDLNNVLSGMLQLNKEVAKMKSKWWRIESKFFKRAGKIKIAFEEHEKYTIIDVFSPDRLGFLYRVTSKMNELGLMIYFAKISTKGDDIVDSFYVLDRDGKKISQNGYDLVRAELTGTISQML